MGGFSVLFCVVIWVYLIRMALAYCITQMGLDGKYDINTIPVILKSKQMGTNLGNNKTVQCYT